MPKYRQKVAYVTWDAPHAPYLESLFLPIFGKLDELEFHVLQFSWADQGRTEELRQFCQRLGVTYEDIRVSRFGSIGPFLSALRGGLLLRRKISNNGFDLVIARSTMPAMATLIAQPAIPFVFDADGLPLDERVEFGHRNVQSVEQRVLRRVEALAVERAQSVLVRTAAARDILIERQRGQVFEDKFHIVTNGRDPALFKPAPCAERRAVRAELGMSDDTPLLVYAGSIGPQYRLHDMLNLLEALLVLRPAARMLLLTGNPDQVRQAIVRCRPNIAVSCDVRSVPFAQVPRYLSAADAGISFRTSSLSMRAVAPIKIGEYLLCGVPVVGTPEIGDIDAAVTAGVFFPVENNSSNAIHAAAEWVSRGFADPHRRDRARQVGLDHFSLQASVRSYRGALSDR